MLIHVATTGSDQHSGTVDAPFATINRAAAIAKPGDTVVVHEGTYREWVQPPRGGASDSRRITFQPADGEHVVIKGSEVVDAWVPDEGLWRATVPNALFGDFNPFAEPVAGDWLVRPTAEDAQVHLGQVYVDGVALPEVSSVEALRRHPSSSRVVDDWTGVSLGERAFAGGWHASVGPDSTTIHLALAEGDPRDALVEINVRRSVFQPVLNHVDFITVRGFELAQAATPWAPPTADQPGLIGVNWAKGWIIEDNVIHDAKCSAVSLGKEIRTGHNFATSRRDKPGYQYQLESVFTARHLGWSRERIGSHIVRRNHIHHCGQNGIVGHLGCVFSVIEDNHIHDIGVSREFYGHEIAGIKLHAGVDVRIESNHVHDCSLGLWLDWQTQGTRVTRNVLHDNSRDLFVEVSHGPYVVDHNVFASPASIENFSQGGAYVANLILGSVRQEPVIDRATPYHVPHSTEVAGYAIIVGGDDRFIGNIFGDGQGRQAYAVELPEIASVGYGTAIYDGFPTSPEAYFAIVESQSGDHRRFGTVRQAVDIGDNCYLGAAASLADERGAVRVPDGDARLTVAGDGQVSLTLNLSGVPTLPEGVARRLGHVRFVGADFEEPDGRPLGLDVDLVGAIRDGQGAVGPVAALANGAWSGVVWAPREGGAR